jgi:undecaprenyl-diphosphatase
LIAEENVLKLKSAILPRASHMDQYRLKTPHVLTTIYLTLTILIGVFAVLLPLNEIECNIVFYLQDITQRTIGLQAYLVLTYLGDYYLWVISASIYLLYAYFRSRKQLGSAIELAIFLVIITALTYLAKIAFARPRPSCSNITVYDEESSFPSFSYPSGHVSRATGAFLILSRKSKIKETLATVAIFTVSLSRIILGAHYLTDIIGGIFLSLAAKRLADLSMLFLISKNENSFCSNRRNNRQRLP